MAEVLSSETLELQTDVLVIGTGGAGLRAALEAKRAGRDVLVVSKMGPDDLNCTIRAWGGFTFAPSGSADELFRQVVETGGFLNNQRLVEVFARETPRRMQELADFGVDFKLWGDNPSPDTLGILKLTAKPPSGFGMTKPLRTKAQAMGVRFQDNVMVSSLLHWDGQIAGAFAYRLRDNVLLSIAAKAVILATGGGASLYQRNDNPAGTTGDGIAMAYHAGADIVDIECVSFQLPAKRLEELFSSADKPAESLLAAGSAHYFLGGVHIDERCRTRLPGLYAAGEVTGGLFGAARLGGAALADTIVFGAIAGREAAQFARARHTAEIPPEAAQNERARLTALLSPDGTPVASLCDRLRELMWRCGGTMKTQQSLQTALTGIAQLESSPLRTPDSTSGDILERIEYLNMLTLARLVVTASLQREETRGCFWRLDFPKPDNARWLRNIHLQKVNGVLHYEARPVVMTRLTTPTQPRIGAGCFSYLPRPAPG